MQIFLGLPHNWRLLIVWSEDRTFDIVYYKTSLPVKTTLAMVLGPGALRVYHFLVFVLYKSIIRCVFLRPSIEKVYT